VFGTAFALRSVRQRQPTHIYSKRVNPIINYIKDHVAEPLPIDKLVAWLTSRRSTSTASSARSSASRCTPA